MTGRNEGKPATLFAFKKAFDEMSAEIRLPHTVCTYWFDGNMLACTGERLTSRKQAEGSYFQISTDQCCGPKYPQSALMTCAKGPCVL